MGLHQQIRQACAAAAPCIAKAAEGSEASIYNLRFAIGDLMEVLVRSGAIVDALEERGISVTVRGPEPQKFA